MKKILCLSTLITVSLSQMTMAHADDVDIGATIGGSYQSALNFNGGDASHVSRSKDKAMPLKIYGAFNFNPELALEAGYKSFGKTTVDPVPGSGSTLSSRSDALYLAMRQSMQLGENWSIFGKLGATRTRTIFTGSRELQALSASEGRTGAYAAIGTAYQVSKDITLTFELEHFGEAHAKGLKFNMDGFSAGIRFRF